MRNIVCHFDFELCGRLLPHKSLHAHHPSRYQPRSNVFPFAGVALLDNKRNTISRYGFRARLENRGPSVSISQNANGACSSQAECGGTYSGCQKLTGEIEARRIADASSSDEGIKLGNFCSACWADEFRGFWVGVVALLILLRPAILRSPRKISDCHSLTTFLTLETYRLIEYVGRNRYLESAMRTPTTSIICGPTRHSSCPAGGCRTPAAICAPSRPCRAWRILRGCAT